MTISSAPTLAPTLATPPYLHKTMAGIVPAQLLARLLSDGFIAASHALDHDQIQPASLDLRLGLKAYRVRASFLPGKSRSVAQRLHELALHEIDLEKGAVLETGCVYIVPLLESLNLPAFVSASTNPKSSTGRLDIFTRVITDRAQLFDKVEAGYNGPLYAEISPTSFPVLVRTGSRLSQIRFRIGSPLLNDAELADIHAREHLVDSANIVLDHGVAVAVDLSGFGTERLVGYRAKKHAGLIDVDRKAACRVSEYWEPLYAQRSGDLVLDPAAFYILASKEAVHVPPDYAAEMVAFDPLVGEFRVHYAGFFDPGFGHQAAGGAGARAVLEVRSHEVPFIIEHGQIVGRLIYERMIERPSHLYGTGGLSNYQGQALKLSKHFKAE